MKKFIFIAVAIIILVIVIILISGLSNSISLPTQKEIESLGYIVTDFGKIPENQRIIFVGHYDANDGDSETFNIQKGNNEKINITITMLKYSSSEDVKAKFDNAKSSNCKTWSTNDMKNVQINVQQIGDDSCGVEFNRSMIGAVQVSYTILFYKGSFEFSVSALRKDKTSWENSPIDLSDIIKLAKFVETKYK